MTSDAVTGAPRLRRTLTLWNLVIIGIVMIQPIAPMGIYGVVHNAARGQVLTTIFIAMLPLLLTPITYGVLARVFSETGPRFTSFVDHLTSHSHYLTPSLH